MEHRANYALVGLFTLAVLAAAFGFVYWFKRLGDNGDQKTYRVVFAGSVSGLSKGSVVRFNGLRIGEVTEISILKSDPSKVEATIRVETSSPIKNDTRARLESQGLTGVASIQLSGGDARSPDLVSDDPKSPPTLFADRSDYQDILETVQRLSGKIDSVLTRADTLLGQSEGSVLATVRNVEAFSKALADNSSGVAAFLANIGDMGQRVGALSGRLERFVDTAEGLMRSLDQAALARTVTNIATFTDALAENKTNVSALIADASTLVKSLQTSGAKLDGALDEITKLAKALDAEKLNRTVDGAERFASALGRNAAGVEGTLKEIQQITVKVSQAADRLDNVMAGAEKFFGGGENNQTAGLMTEVTEAARAIRILAGNLDKRTVEITAGINRFTGPGLRDLEALTAESRRAIGDLSRAVRTLERDPSQLLYGGRSSIPEYRR